MNYGAVFPQTEFGTDPVAIRDYAQQVEDLGFTHILAYDHVLGANPERPGGWAGPYTFEHPFFEPFVLFAHMAAVTTRVGFFTGIIILPQRQTALVAKQAATVDVLSGGRLRLGVGLGWNAVEYTALNQNFHDRGRRVEEQVALLRRLWTEPLIDYAGRWHTVPDAGINPLPVQRPIPIWFGGHADAVLRRTARTGDGWFPLQASADEVRPMLDKLAGYLEQAGRSRSEIGVEARVPYGDGNADTWSQLIDGWDDAGATHVSINTMRCGFETADEHLAAVRRFAEAVGMG